MATSLLCPNCSDNLGKDTENPRKAHCGTCGEKFSNPYGYTPAINELKPITTGYQDAEPICLICKQAVDPFIHRIRHGHCCNCHEMIARQRKEKQKEFAMELREFFRTKSGRKNGS